jgi:GNAT superfamily N-acetyltransferase
MNFELLDNKHLDGILALWNRELADCFPVRPRLLRQNIMDDRLWLREGSWVALEAGTDRVIGFVAAKISREAAAQYGIPRDKGWIHALMVESPHRRSGIGQALLDKAEAALRDAGASHISLGNDLHGRLFPGIPDTLAETKQWFEKRGYAFRELAYDLLHDYDGQQEPAWPNVQNASLRIAVPADREALEAFMERCFPGAWSYQHRDYWERGGTGREYVLLEREGAIIGFCRINDPQSPLLAQNIYWSPLFEDALGGIGPLGIDGNYRGLQYGISIVQAAVQYLLERGMRHIVIDTTPFVDFYGKLGYRSWKSYAKYEKSFNDMEILDYES